MKPADESKVGMRRAIVTALLALAVLTPTACASSGPSDDCDRLAKQQADNGDGDRQSNYDICMQSHNAGN